MTALCTAFAGSPSLAQPPASTFRNQPLVSEIYTADPSAHLFDGKIYVYPSHDIDAGIADDDLGNQYAMRDYRVLWMEHPGDQVHLGPVALDLKDIPWADKQLWAPDAAAKNGRYYLYFPARDRQGVFRIGVASGASPIGPFKAEPEPIAGAYSIDPAVFTDTDGESYLIFGGIWGGQLQRWAKGVYDPKGGDSDLGADDKPALSAKIARLGSDMKALAEPARDLVIQDENGRPLLGGDHDRRFFEGAWMLKRAGRYYLLYSTGDTHLVAYATASSPYGPFTYRGTVLKPVQGWTTHVSTVEAAGRWWLLYHDTQRSGKSQLRNIKMTPLTFSADGAIDPIDPFEPEPPSK